MGKDDTVNTAPPPRKKVDVEVFQKQDQGYQRSSTQEAFSHERQSVSNRSVEATRESAALSPSKSGSKSAKALPMDPAGRGEAMAERLVDSFTNAMEQRLHAKGGVLDASDVAELAHSFEAQKEKLSSFIAGSMISYAQNHSYTRQRVPERLLLQAVQELLNTEVRMRQSLAGILGALSIMMGAAYEKYAERIDARFDQLSNNRHKFIDTAHLLEDEEMSNLLCYLLIPIAATYEDVEMRTAWFMRVMEQQMRQHSSQGIVSLPPPKAIVRLMAGIFSPLTMVFTDATLLRAMAQECGKERITQARLGYDAVRKSVQRQGAGTTEQ